MPQLLLIDPLELVLEDGRGGAAWSSRSCWERAVAEVEGIDFAFASARDPELCQKALASDGVVLGGSERSAWHDDAFNDHLLDLIAICRNGDVPFLGICYGCQLLGRALGGHVARHPWGIELGAVEIELSDAGAPHFLFEGVAGLSFPAIASHSDAVLIPPPDCRVLAGTEHTRVQAIDFRGLLFGLQFHPEMDANDLRCLWEAFGRKGIGRETLKGKAEVLRQCDAPAWPRVLQSFARYAAARSVQTREAAGERARARS